MNAITSAFQIRARADDLSSQCAPATLGNALATAEAALQQVVQLRDNTDMDRDAAFQAMFNSRDAWIAAQSALALIEAAARGQA